VAEEPSEQAQKPSTAPPVPSLPTQPSQLDFPGKAKPKAASPFAASLRRALQQRVAIGFGAGILVILAIAYYAFSSGKGGILVLDTSSDLSIQLNGQTVTGQKDPRGRFIPAYAGVYGLTLTRPNYQPLTLTVTLSRGETVGVRPAYTLLPNSQQSDISTIDFVHASADHKSLLYLGNNGQTLFRFDIAKGIQIPLTDKSLQNIEDVEWSSDPTVALLTQPGHVFLHEIPKYDFRNQITVQVAGDEFESPVWDPLDNTRLAGAYITPGGEESLVFTDRRLARIERKADLSSIPELTAPKLVWAASDTFIALINRSTDTQANDIWLYNTANGDLTKATTGGGVQDAEFSPDGSMLLYQTISSDSANPFHATLNTAKSDGSEKNALGIPGTVAQAAWKDNSSFFLPNPSSLALALYTLDGKRQDVPYALSDPVNIKGMFYFPDVSELIFYTHQAIYTVDLRS
jgi:hypothetical protein